MFHFYSLLCEIASVPRKAPSAWIPVDRLAVLSGVPAEKEKKEMETAATVELTMPVVVDRAGHLVSSNSRKLGSGDVLLRYRIALSSLRSVVINDDLSPSPSGVS
jgi:hypothetical protein